MPMIDGADEPLRHVSVIIPSKDGSGTIDRALASMVTSAAHIREVFIVFSNSPAAYVARCQALPAAWAEHFEIRLLDSGPASNGAIARNTPLPQLRGRYVAYFDDDDEWFDGKLPAYFRFIEQQRLAGDFVVFSTVIGCLEDRSHAIPMPTRAYRGEPIAEFILSFGGGAQTSSLLLPAALAQRVGFDPRLPRHQDYDFCMRLAEHGASFHHLQAPMSYWYQRGSNAAKGGSFEFCRQWVLAQRPRLTEPAFLAYVGKELFAAARAAGDWRTFRRFLLAHLSFSQQVRVIHALLQRALRKLARGEGVVKVSPTSSRSPRS